MQIADSPKERWNELLDELCPDNSFKHQVRELLVADSSDDELLDHSLRPEELDVEAGEHIDGYKLLEELARGGMGVVFMAEQKVPVRRQVALKVIKPGVDTREVIARFDAERQALSLMDHPNIATVLDAGTTDKGRPYFVMELVRGQPITTYCDQNQLSATQRLELFLPVCNAIQHAHQKGIIHRDIKPSNVLVAEYDGRPVAKVIDFGVAKAINQTLTEMTFFTGFGQILGTFEYMSPEQSRVNQLDVDTRSDVYSLGVLLYELLTGGPPFDKERLRSVAWEEMLRIIREEDPPRPSTRIAATTQASPDKARRRAEPAKRGRFVRGELDWIVMKAMEKERIRRYETPNELAADIECFLNGDEVSACPPSQIYRFRKFAKRNKVAFITSAVVAASLILGMIGTTNQAIRASRAERTTEAVNSFLRNDLLGLAGAESQLAAGLQPDPFLQMNTLLEIAADKVDGSFDGQPDEKAAMKSTLADSFNSIGRYSKAAALYEDYLLYLTQENGRKDRNTILVMRQLVRVYINSSELQKAAPLCHEALTISTDQFGAQDSLTAQLLNDQGILYQKQGNYKKAAQQHTKCLNMKRTLPRDAAPNTLIVKSDLALAYESQNLFEDAKVLHKQVLEAYQPRDSASWPDRLRLAASLNNLGRCYLKSGRHYDDRKQFREAVPRLIKGLKIFQDTRGPDHPDTLGVKDNLSQVYCELQQYDLAEPMLKDLVAGRLKSVGKQDVSTLAAMNTLGWTLMQQNQLAEAEHFLLDAAEIHRNTNRIDESTIQVLGNLAIVYHRMGKLEDCVSIDNELLPLANGLLVPDHIEILSSKARLGLSYVETGRVAEGQAYLEASFTAGEHFPGAFEIGSRLVGSLVAEGDFENALRWMNPVINNAKQNLPDNSPRLLRFLVGCGSHFLSMEAWAEAETVLRKCHEIQSERVPDSWLTFRAQYLLGRSLVGQQKYDQAEPYLKAACEWLLSPKDRTGVSIVGLSRRRIRTVNQLIAVYEALNDDPQARKWRQVLENDMAQPMRP